LEADAQGRPDDGDAALARARAIAPAAPRPLLLQGQRALKAGNTALALQLWGELRERHPASFLLVAGAYAEAARASGEAAPAQAALSALLERLPAVELLQALHALQSQSDAKAGAYDGSSPMRDTHAERLARHLRQHPSLSGAQLWLALPEGEADAATAAEGNAALREAVAKAARPLQRYRCAACGFEAQHYFWQCPGCLSWDSYPPQRLDAL
jgi:lipopolysaccharide biosynthesis regulator YciM